MGVAPSVRPAARAVVVAWGCCGGPAHCEPLASAKPSRLWMVACHSSICPGASGNLNSSRARAMASVVVLGIDVDDVDRTVAWLLRVPAVATALVPHPRSCGTSTWAAGLRGGGARGSVAPLGAAVWLACPGGGTYAVTAPVAGAAGGRWLAPDRAPLLWLCPLVGGGSERSDPSSAPCGA